MDILIGCGPEVPKCVIMSYLTWNVAHIYYGAGDRLDSPYLIDSSWYEMMATGF
jgi:hypothetical protein